MQSSTRERMLHRPTEIGSSTSSGLTALRRRTDYSFWHWTLMLSSNITPWRADNTQAALLCPGYAAMAHTFITTIYASSKMDLKEIQPRETRRRTLAHLSVWIRLPLPTLGNLTTPRVMLGAALGLYALRKRSD